MIEWFKLEHEKRVIMAFRHPGIKNYSMLIRLDTTNPDNMEIIPTSYPDYMQAVSMISKEFERAKAKGHLPRDVGPMVMTNTTATIESVFTIPYVREMMQSDTSNMDSQQFGRVETVIDMFDKFINCEQLNLEERLSFKDGRLKENRPFTEVVKGKFLEARNEAKAKKQEAEEQAEIMLAEIAARRVETVNDWGTW